ATRATLTVFRERGFLKIDARKRADRREPREHVRGFFGDLFLRPLPDAFCELADFFREPDEVLVEAALLIALVVRLFDQVLELRQGHGGFSGGACAPRPSPGSAPGAGRRPCRRRSERTRGRACGRLYRRGLRPS